MPDRVRVLFQEDDALIRFTGAGALSGAGMEVVQVENNASARQAILGAETPFDVIVLNGRLPDGRGVELCADLRRQGVTTPVLMQSGDGFLDDYRDAMRAGVSDYLDKPWNKSELVERVRLLLDMPPIVRPSSRSHAFSAGSNIPTVRDYCDARIASAMAHLAAVRPIEGTLPTHQRGTGDEANRDVRIAAFSEEQAAKLLATLTTIENHLARNADDLDERAHLQAALIVAIRSASSWLGGRATVVTDEILKKCVLVGLPLYVAHLAGLRIDLLHILAALGMTGLGH